MSLHERETSVFFPTYKRLPLEIVRGEGLELVDRDGKRYLDMFAGIAVNALGHAHPRVVQAIADQAACYIHVSNYFVQAPQVRLAELLAAHTGYRRVFFCNSGTEAIEGALKIARKWGTREGKTTIVGMSNAFHGRTFGALSAMDRSSYREGFGPFLEGFQTVTFNDASALRHTVNASTAAVLLEFIQGEGGIRPVSPAFVETLLALHQQHGFLILADEIQSGVGRTGAFFAFEHFGVRPDLVTMAKPIGGGLPLGAILGGPRVADVLQPGNHGTTFGGNPVACAAGIAVLSEIADRGLQDHARRMGGIFLTLLQDLQSEYQELIREVRGFGLMVGVELSREGDPAVAAMRDRGILINCTDRTVLRFVPPLTVQEAEIRKTVETLRQVFADWA